MTQSSYIFILLSKISKWFSQQFENSKIIQTFLNHKDRKEISTGSIFTKISGFLEGIFKNIFSSLKLNKLLDESIFVMPFLWLMPVIAFSPFLPTMVVLTLVLVSLLSLFAWLFSNKKNKLKYFTLNKYIIVYIVVYMYAAIISTARISSIKVALLTIGLILFYFVIINAIDTKKKFNIAMIIFIAGGVIVSLYGIYQYLNPQKYSGLWVDTEMFENIEFRVYSTFANPNVLGEYLILVIPFSAAYIITAKTILKKMVATISLLLMLLCLLLTYSRGCYLGILIAAVVFLVMLDKRFIILGFIGIIFLPFIMPESVINRFMSIGDMKDTSTSYRVNIWLGTIDMLKDYWLCGTGPGIDAYNQIYPLYAYSGIAAPHSHNLYLQIMCDAGIVGISTFIAILYKFYRTLLSSFSKEKIRNNKVFIIASISAITAFCVQSMTDYTFYNNRVLLIFWIIMGFGVITTKLSSFKDVV